MTKDFFHQNCDFKKITYTNFAKLLTKKLFLKDLESSGHFEVYISQKLHKNFFILNQVEFGLKM
jgi:hypothetical protein